MNRFLLFCIRKQTTKIIKRYYYTIKWEKQQDEFKEAKERKKTTKEVIAKYFLDISKLVFTAIVLGGFTPMFTDVSINVNWLTIVAGIITTIIFGILGYRILTLK